MGFQSTFTSGLQSAAIAIGIGQKAMANAAQVRQGYIAQVESALETTRKKASGLTAEEQKQYTTNQLKQSGLSDKEIAKGIGLYNKDAPKREAQAQLKAEQKTLENRAKGRSALTEMEKEYNRRMGING